MGMVSKYVGSAYTLLLNQAFLPCLAVPRLSHYYMCLHVPAAEGCFPS